MMITQAHTQLLLQAVGHMSQRSSDKRTLAEGKLKLKAMAMQLNAQREREMLGTKAELFRELLHAMVDRRVDAVRDGFAQVLGLFADQARHYMAEQQRVTEAQIRSHDPLERASFGSRAAEIDLQLRRIRADALKLYKEMNRAVLLIGGSMPRLGGLDGVSLNLPH